VPDFEWDAAKDRVNRVKHGIGFEFAQQAFLDPLRVIAEDLDHGGDEAVFLFWPGRGRNHDGTLHVAKPEDQDFWGGLLAERKGDL
jgi:uncharacterized DUF497 family protein